MKNTIILTAGWTGSSVYSGLLGRAGGWLGDATMHKPDYDTHENAELVRANIRLLQQLAPGLRHEHHFARADVNAIAARASEVDLEPLRRFVQTCSAHQPWVWKDPRLTWTIRLWAPVLDLRELRFLVITRELMQAWITTNLRRHIQSVGFTRNYNDGVAAANVDFLRQHGLPYEQLSFEDLLLRPEATLSKLNAHLGSRLSMDDLHAVCRMPLGKRSKGLKDLAVASAIYLKNHHERDGRRRLAEPGLSPEIR
jgi:hypothetical protein